MLFYQVSTERRGPGGSRWIAASDHQSEPVSLGCMEQVSSPGSSDKRNPKEEPPVKWITHLKRDVFHWFKHIFYSEEKDWVWYKARH